MDNNQSDKSSKFGSVLKLEVNSMKKKFNSNLTKEELLQRENALKKKKAMDALISKAKELQIKNNLKEVQQAKELNDIKDNEKANNLINQDLIKSQLNVQIKNDIKDDIAKSDLIKHQLELKDNLERDKALNKNQNIINQNDSISLNNIQSKDSLKSFKKDNILNEDSDKKEDNKKEKSIFEFLSKTKKISTKSKTIKKEVSKKTVNNNKNISNKKIPLVAIVGHIDHGKTTLVDYIRSSNIAKEEKGQITQNLGAYLASTSHGEIAILDTPGHEIFNNMRSTGVKVADIAVLIVSATEGVRDQTKHAIQVCQNAKIPMIVAINKIDLPDSNPELVKTELIEQNVIAESMGGDIICNEISAKTGQGVEDLLENIAAMFEIYADSIVEDESINGYVINSMVDKALGRCACLVLKNGIINKGDFIIFNDKLSKIKHIKNTKNEFITRTNTSEPIIVYGLKELPSSGESFILKSSESEANVIVNDKIQHNIDQSQAEFDLFNSNKKSLSFLVRACSDSTVEAVVNLIEAKNKAEDDMDIRVINHSIGKITENDFEHFTEDMYVIGFGVGIDSKVYKMFGGYVNRIICSDLIQSIDNEIIDLIENIKITGTKKIIGRATIKEVFDMKKIGYVCGCVVDSGSISINENACIVRNGEVIRNSKITSIKYHKKDIKEQTAKKDCGVIFDNINSGIEPGDIIECYKIL